MKGPRIDHRPPPLWEVLRFEVALQLRRPSTWVMLGLFMLPLVGVASDDLVDAQRRDVFYRAPLFAAQFAAVMGSVALLILASVAGDAATRDIRTRIEPLMLVAPVDRLSYVGGRFLGALAVAAALLAVVPVVHLLVPLFRPEIGGDVLGPVRLASYARIYLLILLPNAFIATALLFTLATAVRHGLGSWLGVVALFVTVQFTQSYFGDVLGRWDLARALDPTGLNALDWMAQTWSPTDLNERSVATPALLWNRALWTAVAGASLAIGVRRYDPGRRSWVAAWWRKTPLARGRALSDVKSDVALHPRVEPVSSPRADRTFDLAGRARQFAAVVRDSLREIAPRWTWWLAPLLVLGQAAITLSGLAGAANGTPVLPTTPLVLGTLGPLAGEAPPPVVLAAILLPILLAGELVWRERDANLAALIDTTPVPNVVLFAGKVTALWLVLGLLVGLLTLGGIGAQIRLGWSDLDLGLYATVSGLRMVRVALFGLVAVCAHVVVNQKHLGTVLTLLLVTPLIGELFGIEHPLLLIGWSPPWHLSTMTGLGPWLPPILAFDLYWSAGALMVGTVAHLLWTRGATTGFAARLHTAKRRLHGPVAGILAGSVGLVVATGGFVFYNTNVLNTYRTSDETAAAAADYERRYGASAWAPRPDLVATDLNVELHPDERRAEIAGTHQLVNRTGHPLDTLRIATSPNVETGPMEFDRTVRLALQDDVLGHRVVVLEPALEPGDSLTMRWAVTYAPRGFSADGAFASVVPNGSFIVAADWIPQVGYLRGRELGDPVARREHGLPPRRPLPPPDDPAAPFDRYGRDQLRLSVTMGTAPGETAVAPGRLAESWSADGRDYFRYETNAPVGNGYALFSADYAVRRGRWNGVDIEILHHPEHTANLDRMMRSMEASLAQFTERFGPFPYDVLKMVEYPAEGGSLHAASATIWYREMFSHFDPARDPRGVDMPFAVTAHEVAHQFQPTPAVMEGAILLSESFAWYAAMGVIESELGTDQLTSFLDYMRRSYLTPRARADVPLVRATDSFQGYRKGPFAMYALREYVGRGPVDAAWRALRERYDSEGEPPYATSLDLVRELRAVTPDSLQSLIGDLLERNTYWTLSTTAVAAEPEADGGWRVDLEVAARKVVVDTAGIETERPMDDLVEIGIFGDPGEGPPAVLHHALHRIRSGTQTLSIRVPVRPAHAGIDPRHLLLDVSPNDNLMSLPAASAEGGRP